MKLLYITGLYSRDKEPLLNTLSKIGLQNAPNVFQWAIIDGLVQNEVDFEVISCPFLPAFPISFKRFITPASVIIHNGKRKGEMLSYCDLAGFKSISIGRVVYKYICEWARRNLESKEPLVLLTYTPYPSFLPCIKRLKKEYNLTVATIVTDLVDDMLHFESNRTFLKRIQSSVEIVQTKSKYPYIDKYILLSKYMVEKIPQAKDKYIVIEGIATKTEKIETKEQYGIRSFLYTGTLESFGCVDSLVRAFMKINNPDIRLIICGSGPLAKMIKEAASEDGRIDFRGLVSRDEAIRLQKEATLLVNPRKPNGSITKYSFPSKTMEYLSSGTPMIGYKLEGIPEEYYSYYFTVNALDEKSLVSTLSKTIMKPQDELNQMAQKAFEFIQGKKTSKLQIRKIIDFLD